MIKVLKNFRASKNVQGEAGQELEEKELLKLSQEEINQLIDSGCIEKFEIKKEKK